MLCQCQCTVPATNDASPKSAHQDDCHGELNHGGAGCHCSNLLSTLAWGCGCSGDPNLILPETNLSWNSSSSNQVSSCWPSFSITIPYIFEGGLQLSLFDAEWSIETWRYEGDIPCSAASLILVAPLFGYPQLSKPPIEVAISKDIFVQRMYLMENMDLKECHSKPLTPPMG